MIEIHLEKGIGWVDLFRPDGVRHDFETAGMRMTKQTLQAVALAQTANAVSPGVKTSPSKRAFHPKYRSSVGMKLQGYTEAALQVPALYGSMGAATQEKLMGGASSLDVRQLCNQLQNLAVSFGCDPGVCGDVLTRGSRARMHFQTRSAAISPRGIALKACSLK
jgi:hypothetical protein